MENARLLLALLGGMVLTATVLFLFNSKLPALGPASVNQLVTQRVEQNQAATPSSQLTIITENPVDFSRKLYNLINAYRQEQSLSPLRISPLLENSSQAKLNDMITNHYWRHQDVAGLESWYLFRQAGYNFDLAGENLAFGGRSSWQVFRDWTESSTHNQQLLTNEYEDMGLAVDCTTYSQYAGDGGCLVVLHLGKQ